MSRKPTRPEADELDRLYAAGRDIEPEPGLDRIIRARAEQAEAPPRSHRPVRWLGGLATAAALVLTVGVVMQQGALDRDELAADFSEPAPPPERASPAPAAESPSPGPGLDRIETRTVGEAPVVRSRSADSDQAVTLGRQQRAEALDATSGLAAFSEPSEADVLAETEAVEGESDEADALLARAADMSEQDLLDWITELLEQGELARAGQLLHHLGERQDEGAPPKNRDGDEPP